MTRTYGHAILQFRAYSTVKKMAEAVRTGQRNEHAFFEGQNGETLECRPTLGGQYQWFLDGHKCTQLEAEAVVLAKMYHDRENKSG